MLNKYLSKLILISFIRLCSFYLIASSSEKKDRTIKPTQGCTEIMNEWHIKSTKGPIGVIKHQSKDKRIFKLAKVVQDIWYNSWKFWTTFLCKHNKKRLGSIFMQIFIHQVFMCTCRIMYVINKMQVGIAPIYEIRFCTWWTSCLQVLFKQNTPFKYPSARWIRIIFFRMTLKYLCPKYKHVCCIERLSTRSDIKEIGTTAQLYILIR